MKIVGVVLLLLIVAACAGVVLAVRATNGARTIAVDADSECMVMEMNKTLSTYTVTHARTGEVTEDVNEVDNVCEIRYGDIVTEIECDFKPDEVKDCLDVVYDLRCPPSDTLCTAMGCSQNHEALRLYNEVSEYDLKCDAADGFELYINKIPSGWDDAPVFVVRSNVTLVIDSGGSPKYLPTHIKPAIEGQEGEGITIIGPALLILRYTNGCDSRVAFDCAKWQTWVGLAEKGNFWDLPCEVAWEIEGDAKNMDAAFADMCPHGRRRLATNEGCCPKTYGQGCKYGDCQRSTTA